MDFVEDFGAKFNSVRDRHTKNFFCFFALEVMIILWPLTSDCHILTVSNYQVCSNDKSDL